MKDYNFDSDNGQFDETRRLDDINRQVKLKQNLSAAPDEELGDRNAFLDSFESEKIAVRPQPQQKIIPPSWSEEYDDAEPEEEEYEKDRRWLKIGLLIAVIVGLLVCIAGFVIMSSFLKNGKISPAQQESSQSLSSQNEAKASQIESMVLIMGLGKERELSVREIGQKKNTLLRIDTQSRIFDKNGIALKHFVPIVGDVVSVLIDTSDNTVEKMYYPNTVWSAENVTQFQLDTKTKTLQTDKKGIAGQENLSYTDDTLFLYKENKISPEEIHSCDTLTLQGSGKNLLSVRVKEYHGDFRVLNASAVQNGALQIDDGEWIPLSDVQDYSIAEGSHEITITGDNIETRVDNIFIVPNETYELDLSTVQPKTGVLVVQANVDEYQLYVNGVAVDPAEPVVLPQGKQEQIEIEKEGYQSWTDVVTLQEDFLTLTAELLPAVPLCDISISTTPETAKIFLNGEEKGTTPYNEKLAYGTYSLQIQCEGYQDYIDLLTINKRTFAVNISLSKDSTSLTDGIGFVQNIERNTEKNIEGSSVIYE